MFRNPQADKNPFDILYGEVGKPNTSDAAKYPTHLTHGSDSVMAWEAKGRFSNIVTLLDEQFPEYNANLIKHKVGGHVLLEGPAQHSLPHCERFMAVLMNNNVNITDVIAAGDPLDGRSAGKRGYWHYFSHDNKVEATDSGIMRQLSSRYNVTSTKTGEVGGISSYQLTIRAGDAKTRQINVHHIVDFGDFKTMIFTAAELKALLAIYHQSENLAIHCSAGMGRTGVIELAYCLFADYEKFYPAGKPDLNQIKFKLEDLRVQRPVLIQGYEQYRMAVIVGMQLALVHRNELISDAELKEVESVVDDAAKQAVNPVRNNLAPESSDEEDNQVSESSRHSGDESNEVSHDEADSSEEQSPASLYTRFPKK